MATILMPWNPVIWWQLFRLRTAVELDCDRRVIAAGASVCSYTELLLALGGRPRPGGWLLRPALVQLETTLGRRIVAMLDRNVRLRFQVLSTTAGLRQTAPLSLIDRVVAAGFLPDPFSVTPAGATSSTRPHGYD